MYQFTMGPGTLSKAILEEFQHIEGFLNSPKEQVLKDSKIYLKEIYVQNLTYRAKSKAQVSVFIPSEFIKTKVFTLTQDHIVYEDQDIVVLDKPAGLPTQPTLKSFEDHLYGATICYYTLLKPQKLAYVGLHHRLDRDTSGLVLMTKRPSANKSIADQFKDRHIKKKYIACVEGEKPNPEIWSVEAPIGRIHNYRGGFKFGVDLKKGDKALTHFKYLSSLNEKRHLIECTPVTGRTHQIRIHLSYSRLPIVGDRTYGTFDNDGLQLLAHQLEFLHPKTKKMITVRSQQELSFQKKSEAHLV